MTHECSAHAEWKNYEILLFVMLTSILTWKSNAHPGRPHLWVNFLIVWRETPVKCLGMPGGWAVLELNGTLPLLSWLKKRVSWFQSHWNNAIDAKTAGQFDSSMICLEFPCSLRTMNVMWTMKICSAKNLCLNFSIGPLSDEHFDFCVHCVIKTEMLFQQRRIFITWHHCHGRDAFILHDIHLIENSW